MKQLTPRQLACINSIELLLLAFLVRCENADTEDECYFWTDDAYKLCKIMEME